MRYREVLEHIAEVDQRHVARLTEDIDSMTAELKREGAPPETIELLMAMRESEREVWQISLDRVRKLLEGSI